MYFTLYECTQSITVVKLKTLSESNPGELKGSVDLFYSGWSAQTYWVNVRIVKRAILSLTGGVTGA